MWDLLRVQPMEPNELLGKFPSEDEAIEVMSSANEPPGTFLMIASEDTIHWTTESGKLERVSYPLHR